MSAIRPVKIQAKKALHEFQLLVMNAIKHTDNYFHAVTFVYASSFG